MIGASLFVFNVQVELLQICRPLLMAIVLQLPLCLYKLKRSVISMDDRLPLASLHNGIHLFIICRVLSHFIVKCLSMIGHWMHVLGEDYTNSIA